VLLLGMLSTLLVVPMTTYAQAQQPQQQVQGPGQGQGQGRVGAPGQNKGNSFPVKSSGTATVAGSETKVPVDFNGNFVVKEFKTVDGQLMAHGTLSGTLTGLDKSVDVPSHEVDMPVQSINDHKLASGGTSDASEPSAEPELTIAQAQPSCAILNLILGPLHLDLLGLVVDLNQVILNITGQTGAGNLLGNLLCGIFGILDPTPPVGALTNLLNALLAALNL